MVESTLCTLEETLFHYHMTENHWYTWSNDSLPSTNWLWPYLSGTDDYRCGEKCLPLCASTELHQNFVDHSFIMKLHTIWWRNSRNIDAYNQHSMESCACFWTLTASLNYQILCNQKMKLNLLGSQLSGTGGTSYEESKWFELSWTLISCNQINTFCDLTNLLTPNPHLWRLYTYMVEEQMCSHLAHCCFDNNFIEWIVLEMGQGLNG